MARFLYTSDWHIRVTAPRYRTDNFYQTQKGKINWQFELAYNENCDGILHGGDMFDRPEQPDYVKIDLLTMIYKYGIPIYTVAGQHDLLYRKFDKTTLALLSTIQSTNIVFILNNHLYRINDCIDLYGASWEEEIPEVEDPEAVNILAAHKMIVEDKPLWYGQTDYISAKDFMKKHNFDLVVSGDNHKSFTYETNGRYLINCGSLMRINTSQRDHKPVAYIYDTETNELTQHFIPVKPIEEVMNLELADEVKERTEELTAFVDGLSSDYDTELSFEENLKSVMSVNETPNHIKEIANEIVGEYYNL